MPAALDVWLGERSFADFLARDLGRQPVARPSSAGAAAALFDWETLDRLLRREGLDLLVIRDGRERAAERPGDLAAARRLLARGLGLVLRRAEREDEGLAELARSFERDLSGAAHVQLFATPAQSSGFGWHYDAEEVFVVQTRGTKDFYFRRNTVDPDPVAGAQPDFARVREERTPLMTCTLEPGDWLHLPRGWWHGAKARDEGLSISIGVTRPDGAVARVAPPDHG